MCVSYDVVCCLKVHDSCNLILDDLFITFSIQVSHVLKATIKTNSFLHLPIFFGLCLNIIIIIIISDILGGSPSAVLIFKGPSIT